MTVSMGTRTLAFLSVGALGPAGLLLVASGAGAGDATAAPPGTPRDMDVREASRTAPGPVPEDLHGRLIERVLEVDAAWRDLDAVIASLEGVVHAHPDNLEASRDLEALLAARERIRRQRGRWNEPWSSMLVPRRDPAETLRNLGGVSLHLAELSHLRARAYAHVDPLAGRPTMPALAEISAVAPDAAAPDPASVRGTGAGIGENETRRERSSHETAGASPGSAPATDTGVASGDDPFAVPVGASGASPSPGAVAPLPETARRYLADMKEGLTSARPRGEPLEPPPDSGASNGPDAPTDDAESLSWWHWALFGYAVAAAAALLLLAVRALLDRLRDHGKDLERRLRRVAAPLATPAAAQAQASGAQSILRETRRRSRLARPIESRYPLLDPRRAFPVALAAGVAAAGLAWFALWFLRIPAGGWTLPVAGLAGAGGLWYALGWQQAREEAAFVRQFPEVVDQVVRLAGAGVPSVEALTVVAADAPPPVRPILERVCDALLAGVDPDTALRMETTRTRLVEFTMFAAVLRLQRRAGGGVSDAFANLAKTLRERHRASLKARSSTAQSRLALLVLAVMPAGVLVAQKFTSPASVEALFGTEQGTTLLRAGTGLIVVGLVTARAIAARAAR